MKNWKNCVVGLVLLLLSFPLSTFATHLRAGEITVERLGCTSLNFRITITVYTNTGSDIKFGQGTLDFGDGSTFKTPTRPNELRPDLGENVGTVSFPIEHVYSGPGRYVISYVEPNRNANILNLYNSVETQFYIETVINIDPLLGCNNSPKLLVPPIDKACKGAAWYHNPGAYDPDGDSISFVMTVPKQNRGVNVFDYRDPNTQEFYGATFPSANEDKNGPPTFGIDPVTGTITWDAPGAIGEYNIAFLIKEWRKVNGVWIQMGYVTRDMQIIVDDCNNKHPELLVPQDICVEAGTLISQDIFGFDPDNDPVLIEGFSQVFQLEPNRAELIVPAADGGYQTGSQANPAKVTFKWQTDCSHIKEQPYQVVFKITDRPTGRQGQNDKPTRLIEFKTWNITVVGPAPKWTSVNKVPGQRQANLKWESYTCSEKATEMQVWRRVDSYAFTPPECVTGMPDALGYTKIATVPIGQTNYLDTNNGRGLSVGAQYCYRLVAVFPAPGGGESYVSTEVCMPPIPIDIPIITNVSIDKTAPSNGQISVRWTSPFEANQVDFPRPYTYELYRAEGITGNIKLTKVHSGALTDTTYVDADGALNTESQIYNYRVIAYDAVNKKIGRSDSASTVRLEAQPLLKKIQITWLAEVPWSNKTLEYPLHDIYRGANGTKDDQLQLIATVDVNANGFTYTDDGSWNQTPLKETDTYCYRVMTRGSYGNDKLQKIDPLQNFSQTLCAQPSDNTPPCAPVLSIVQPSCEDRNKLECGYSTFTNTLTWSVSCRAEVKYYNIYEVKIGKPDTTLLATNVVDTFFVDDASHGLLSFARCYLVQSVDRSGNKSQMSERFCFDNCPYYELPNVFTPNDDNCNDVFSAFSGRVAFDENSDGFDRCGNKPDFTEIRRHCARFVNAVEFKVYNRWGKQVYDYSGDIFGQGGEKSIYIDWDGTDSQGTPLSAGVYYYVARVTYDVVDPSQANQTIKGWVHLVR